MKSTNKKAVWLWRAGFLLLPAAALLAGCSREDAPGSGSSGDAVELHAGIATRTAAGGNEWLTSDEVGILMLEAGSDITQSAPYGLNVKYNPASDGGTALLLPADSDQQLFWPLAAGRYDFIAYYPWQAIEGNEFTYSVDITDPDAELDILYTREQNKFTGSAIGFKFSHKMARLRINIQAEGMVSDEDIASLSLTLKGVPVKAEMALSTGQVSPIDPVDSDELILTAHETVTPGYDATFEAIVVPHKYSDYLLRHLVIGIGGIPLYWNFPKVDDVSEGKVKVYNLKVKGQDVSLISSTINEWEDQGDPDEGQLGKTTVKIEPESNCYMLAPDSEEVYIPVSQANRVLTEDGLGAATTGLGGVTADNFMVELVWSDTPVGYGNVIEYMYPATSEGEGYICLKPGRKGNAVIAIRDKQAETIKWSWHIWVTEKVDELYDSGSDITWMDRNLGAIGAVPYDLVDGIREFNEQLWFDTFGMYYQWGRKDPLPTTDRIFDGVNTGKTGTRLYYTPQHPEGTQDDLPMTTVYDGLSQIVQNPLMFISSTTYTGSLDGLTENDSWGKVSGDKTIYDPCPSGWRVPLPQIGTPAQGIWGPERQESNEENAIWSGNYWDDRGRYFHGLSGELDTYYPGAGARSHTPPIFVSNGYYWSSGFDENGKGVCLVLLSGTLVWTEMIDYRAKAYQVRCIREM